MGKPAVHKMPHICGYDVCMHSTLDETGRCIMSKEEALQLAKDLLDACGESEPNSDTVMCSCGNVLTVFQEK